MRRHALWRPGVMLVAALSAAASARAAEPVAIVEAAAGVTEPGPMTMLPAGRVIELGASGHIELGYLYSCWHETIDGGKVTIGVERSEIEGGRVVRELVECDSNQLSLSEAEAEESGVMVFRRAPPEHGAAPPVINIFSRHPVVRLPEGASALLIERLDAAEPARRIEVTGLMLDLAPLGVALSPGGRYRLSSGAAAAEIAVDPLAEAGVGPLVGRLVRLDR